MNKQEKLDLLDRLKYQLNEHRKLVDKIIMKGDYSHAEVVANFCNSYEVEIAKLEKEIKNGK
ncbi:MAG: hypothetical protein RSE19_06500 [Myroides sp.]